jgi:hypothetical protein
MQIAGGGQKVSPPMNYADTGRASADRALS